MACVTCDHTMQRVGNLTYWCPRCGTIKVHEDSQNGISRPWLVERVHKMRALQGSSREGTSLRQAENNVDDSIQP